MRSRRVFAAFLALTVPCSLSAEPPEMQPIEKFFNENIESSSGSTEVFVSLRCSSMYGLLAIHNPENAMTDESKRFSELADVFLMMAYESQNPKNESFLLDQIILMVSAYKDRFLKAEARTGNFSDDPVIASDIAFCDSLTRGDE